MAAERGEAAVPERGGASGSLTGDTVGVPGMGIPFHSRIFTNRLPTLAFVLYRPPEQVCKVKRPGPIVAELALRNTAYYLLITPRWRFSPPMSAGPLTRN